MEGPQPARRRHHDADLKRRVLAECAEPGASVAHVALARGLNANLVHEWRRKAAGASAAVAPATRAAFVPMALAAEPARADVRIEPRRGPTTIVVTWPVSAAAECAAWMRELQR
jgi:transposase